MGADVLASQPTAQKPEGKARGERYASVEIPIRKLGVVYQFKVWPIHATAAFILVREDSQVLPSLKKGETLRMKFYPENRSAPSTHLDTTVQHAGKMEDGRFRGHYLVELAFPAMESREPMRLVRVPKRAQVLPMNPLAGHA